MRHSHQQNSGRFLSTFQGDVGGLTRSSWTRAHTWLLLQALLVSLFLALTKQASAQEMAGPQMVVRRADGSGTELPLVQERLSVVIDQGHAASTFSHTFQNETRDLLEGNYRLSLGAVATATGFYYFNGEQKIVGEIFEKEAAARIYETVAGTGRDPGLLEQTGEGVFSFRVAPITPSEKKRVGVTTSQWLRQTGNVLEYQAPLGRDGKDSTLTLIDTRVIKNVTSPSHDLKVTDVRGKKQVRVLGKKGSAKAAATGPDTLIVRYEVEAEPFELSTSVHRSKGEDGYVVVSVSAPLSYKQKRAPRDVTIVVDRSGSMSGEPLSAARRATRGVLTRLRPDDYVNVVSFDDDVYPLFSAPKPVKDARTEALSFVDAIEAGGGTDIGRALAAAFDRMPKSSRPSVVLFLTDGQSDAAAALTAAGRAPSGTRIYTVGIGAGVDRPLLSRMARESHGSFTYVADEKNLERDVNQLFSGIEQPVLSDVSLELSGAKIERLYPRTAPDLFERDQLTFALRISPEKGRENATLKVKGTLAGKSKTLSKTLDLKAQSKAWVGRMWASARVDDLLEQMSLSGETDELKRETLELALAYDLVTRYTSFLAIPESEVSDAVRGTLEEERARRQAILTKHSDAASLSRDLMPPGDPLLTLRAPGSARGVTAVFSFGLVLDLSYSKSTELWEGRFLVPNTVRDGKYSVELFITDRDGQVTTTTTGYEIDSQAPAFEANYTEEIGGALLKVETDEPVREVRVVSLGESGAPSDALSLNGRTCGALGCNLGSQSKTVFEGQLKLPVGVHRIRIVVTDEARNESTRILAVRVGQEDEGC